MSDEARIRAAARPDPRMLTAIQGSSKVQQGRCWTQAVLTPEGVQPLVGSRFSGCQVKIVTTIHCH